MLVPDTV